MRDPRFTLFSNNLLLVQLIVPPASSPPALTPAIPWGRLFLDDCDATPEPCMECGEAMSPREREYGGRRLVDGGPLETGFRHRFGVGCRPYPESGWEDADRDPEPHVYIYLPCALCGRQNYPGDRTDIFHPGSGQWATRCDPGCRE